jgi:ribosomal protein S27AE
MAGVKDVNLNIRIDEDLRKEFYRVAELHAQNPSALVRGWVEDYIVKHGDVKRSKVAVTCPHCGHMTHVDLPTKRQGQVCGVCRVGYTYPWVKEDDEAEE